MKNHGKGPELLAPAGDMNCLKAAIKAGANAVYVAGRRFSARAFADNFSEGELLEAVDYAHLRGVKVYLAVNTLVKEREFGELSDFIYPYYIHGIDGIILQDIGAISFVHTFFPQVPIHVSTQAAVTNVRSAIFFKNMGAKRIVTARELSLEEIMNIRKQVQIEVETFIHGAMCYSYSGLCLMSSMIGGRSGNRGQCAQPCRLPYKVEGHDYRTILSMKDMCTLDLIPELMDSGIDSLKIEGRMKQPDYVYTVTALYRKYIQRYLETPDSYRVTEGDRNLALGVYTRRGYSEGYYHKMNGCDMISFAPEKKNRPENADEIIEEDDKTKVRAFVKFCVGEKMSLTLTVIQEEGTVSVTEYGDLVEIAKNAPLTEIQIKKQICKSGKTPFWVEDVAAEIIGEGYLPISRMNALRRETFSRLEESMLEKSRRRAFDRVPGSEGNQEPGGKNPDEICGYVFTVLEESQFFLVDSRVSGVIISIDSESAKAVLKKKTGRNLYYVSMPYVFRDCHQAYYQKFFSVIKEFDGALVRDWGAYLWLKECGFKGKIIADSQLYVFNKRAKQIMRNLDLYDFVCSQELNKSELMDMPGGGILTVYGYQPVMISANCVRKTTGTCTGHGDFLSIKDRMKKKFHIKINCEICYNVIYNADRLYLIDRMSEVQTLSPSHVKVDFTLEGIEDCDRVITAILSGTDSAKPEDLHISEYTRGHFYRGVK